MSALLQRISIDSTFGACLVGAQISAMLYGLTTLQTYFYYTFYPEDLVENKALVCIIWFLDTLHTAFITTSMYHYLVTNYDNPPSLSIGHWSLFTSIGVNTVIACIVQTFFVIRIYRFANSRVKWWLTSIIGISVIAHFCFGVETLVLMFIKKELAKLSKFTLYSATPFAVFAVLSDVLIAGSLCVLLHESRTGYRKTNSIVTTLIVYAINRCLLTSIVAVVEVIVFKVMPSSLWFLAIDFVIGKLYANSLLATLNSRQFIRSGDAQINSTHLSDVVFVEPTDFSSSGGTRTDSGALVLALQVESSQQSCDIQSDLSVNAAKDKMSPTASYHV